MNPVSNKPLITPIGTPTGSTTPHLETEITPRSVFEITTPVLRDFRPKTIPFSFNPLEPWLEKVAGQQVTKQSDIKKTFSLQATEKTRGLKDKILDQFHTWFWSGKKKPLDKDFPDLKNPKGFSICQNSETDEKYFLLTHSGYAVPFDAEPETIRHLIKILHYKKLVPENIALEKPSKEFNLLQWLDWTLCELIPREIIVPHHVSRDIWKRVETKQITSYRVRVTQLYLQLQRNTEFSSETQILLEDVLIQAIKRNDPRVIFENFAGEHQRKSRYYKFGS